MNTKLGIAITLAALATLAFSGRKPADPVAAEKAIAAFKGTWAGKSTCVDDQAACKNELIVYRFVPFTGAPWQLRLLADRIVEKKRVPIGAFMCQYDEKKRGLRCEVANDNMRGAWVYTLNGDSLVGEFLLPDGDRGRDLRAIRVLEAHVPAAPPLKAYDR